MRGDMQRFPFIKHRGKISQKIAVGTIWDFCETY
jgi:hypothetical protein